MFKPVCLLVFASFTALAAAATTPTSSSAQDLGASGPQCFRANNVSRFLRGPSGFLFVRTQGNRWFQLHLSPGCPDFRLIMEIGLRPSDSQWLCEGKAEELGGLPPSENGQCSVTDIRQLPVGAVPGI